MTSTVPPKPQLATTGQIRQTARMNDRIAEDARFALLAKVRQARMMSAGAKFRAGSELFDEACAWNLAGISAQHPGASEAEKQHELLRRLKLADQINR